jgi:hypothetical protein
VTPKRHVGSRRLDYGCALRSGPSGRSCACSRPRTRAPTLVPSSSNETAPSPTSPMNWGVACRARASARPRSPPHANELRLLASRAHPVRAAGANERSLDRDRNRIRVVHVDRGHASFADRRRVGSVPMRCSSPQRPRSASSPFTMPMSAFTMAILPHDAPISVCTIHLRTAVSDATHRAELSSRDFRIQAPTAQVHRVVDRLLVGFGLVQCVPR